MKAALGIIGLGVMGKSLSRNFGQNGVRLALYNRHVAGKEENVAKNHCDQFPELKEAQAFDDLKLFVKSLEQPRKILMMVTSEAVENTMDALRPLLDPGDVIVDGGNTHYEDTNRRLKSLETQGLLFLGMGISGGEKGALEGPSLMPGGSREAYEIMQPFLSKIAAVGLEGILCSAYVGSAGAGHFVKMVHNGIEYVEMQLIAEAYGFLKNALGYNNEQIAGCFEAWCQSTSNSYLLDISTRILRKKEDGIFLLEKIVDVANHKGTGVWAAKTANELGVPATLMQSALQARQLSGLKHQRANFSQLYNPRYEKANTPIETLKKGYEFSRLLSFHQGFDLLRAASEKWDWQLNLEQIASLWTEGSIVKSHLLQEVKRFLPNAPSLLEHPQVIAQLLAAHEEATSVVVKSYEAGVPMPCFSSALTYYQLISQKESTANVIQAQRDFFGAHKYQRTDAPADTWHHTQWNKP